MQPTSIRLSIPDSIDPTRLMGPADANLRRVEAAFEALVSVRGNQVLVSGSAEQVDLVTQVFSRLIRLVEAGECPQASDVDLLVDQVCHGAQRADLLSDDILLTYRGRALRPKTAGQKRYIDAIRRSTITFGIGPAGTGKTYLAMAMAVAALKRKEVGRIVLTRPVVEAGESLGFLPGTLQEKLDPYVRPLYDALLDMTDMERGNALHARAHPERRLRHPRRGTEHYPRADEDVSHAPGLWLQVRGDWRRLPARPSRLLRP